MDVEKLRAWLDTDEGKADFLKFWNECNGKDEFTQSRYMRFEAWLETNDFDKLMSRLILEHDDDYIDKCYKRGHMPSANNKLSFVIGYVCNNYEPIYVSQLDSDFANETWQFRGYYFQHIHGQGTITRIYNKDDMKMLLQI